MLRQTPRTFVEQLDFRSTVGQGDGPGSRERLGLRGAGVTVVVTDLGVLEPDPETRELTLTRHAPGRDRWSRRARQPRGRCACAGGLDGRPPAPTRRRAGGAARDSSARPTDARATA